MPARSSSYALGLVLAAAACFVFNAGVSRVVLRAGVDPAVLTTIRVTGATLVFAGWAAVARRSALRPPRGRQLAVVVLLGVVGVAGIQWTYFVAIDRLPVGLALLLQFTGPILVAVYARLVRHENVRPRAWAGLVVATVGLGLVARVWEGLAFDGLGCWPASAPPCASRRTSWWPRPPPRPLADPRLVQEGRRARGHPPRRTAVWGREWPGGDGSRH